MVESELELIAEIAEQFGLGQAKSSKKLDGGIVNLSYKVETSEGNFIVQQLSSIWDKRVIDDYRSVQRYLRTNGIHVPVLLNDINERPYFIRDRKIWRAFEYVENDGISKSSPEIAYEAGKILGKFHKVMQASSFKPSFKLEGFHDTQAIIKKLQEVAIQPQYQEKYSVVKQEFNEIIDAIQPLYLPDDLPKTLIHGDPKLANFLFKDNKVISVLDLDTMMHASELIDLGDALRSWCKSGSVYRPEIFDAALNGYRETNSTAYDDSTIKNAMNLINLELCARFLTDYFQESYFAFDSNSEKTRAQQNLDKARFYLDYFKSCNN